MSSIFSRPEAERTIVAALMRKPDYVPYVAIKLKPEHFADKEMGTIYGGILKVHSAGRKVNYITVSDEIGSQVADKLKTIPGDIVSANDASEAAEMVIDQWMLREISNLKNVPVKDTDDPWTVVDMIQAKLFEISAQKTGSFEPLSKSYPDLIKSFNETKEHVPYWGLPDLERQIGGVGEGELVIVSARPGAGKSSLFNNRVVTCVKEKRPIVFWSGEMSQTATLRRFVTAYTDRDFNDPEADHVRKSVEEIENLVYYSFGPMTWEDFKPQIIHYHLTMGCRDFLIDRLELLFMSGRITEDERIKRINGELRLLATKYGLRIDMAVQMRKSAESNAQGVPILADILGGTATANDATKVILINRPESRHLATFPDGFPASGKGEFIVAKNTFGPTCDSHRLDYLRTRQLWQESPF